MLAGLLQVLLEAIPRQQRRLAGAIEGTARARSIHKTQADAAKAGSAIARKNESELLIHGRDGKIRERSTYGHDPRRTKG